MARVRSTASTIFFLPSLDRWDRPSGGILRASGVHPGRLAQGPDEKSGRAGRAFGFVIFTLSLTEELHSGGGAWPAASIGAGGAGVNVGALSQQESSGSPGVLRRRLEGDLYKTLPRRDDDETDDGQIFRPCTC